MKLAVIFPGIGYHTDKPLLYYSKKIAKNAGYEIKEVPYGNFPKNIKSSPKKMEQAFASAFSQTEAILKEIDFSQYKEILFVSKSIGTAIAAAYARKYGLHTGNVYYTPVEASFSFMNQNGTDPDGIVFHGTSDSWARTEVVRTGCEKGGYPLYITEGANHSLETGNVAKDLLNLQEIMRITEAYINAK